MEQTEEQKIYTLSEAAQMLAFTREQITRVIESAKLRAYRQGGRWYITADDLTAFCESGNEFMAVVRHACYWLASIGTLRAYTLHNSTLNVSWTDPRTNEDKKGNVRVSYPMLCRVAQMSNVPSPEFADVVRMRETTPQIAEQFPHGKGISAQSVKGKKKNIGAE